MKKLCEALKVNTGLTELELESQDNRCVGIQGNIEQNNCVWSQAVNLELKGQGH